MLQLIIGGSVVLSLIYWVLSAYSRSTRREALEREFDAGGIPGLREEFIAKGLADYDRGLRPKLMRLVFVIPVALILVIAYVVNHR